MVTSIRNNSCRVSTRKRALCHRNAPAAGDGGAGEPRLACLCAFSSLSSWVVGGPQCHEGHSGSSGRQLKFKCRQDWFSWSEPGRALQPPFRPSESSAQAFDRFSRGLIPFSFRKAELLTTYLKCDFHNRRSILRN